MGADLPFGLLDTADLIMHQAEGLTFEHPDYRLARYAASVLSFHSGSVGGHVAALFELRRAIDYLTTLADVADAALNSPRPRDE